MKRIGSLIVFAVALMGTVAAQQPPSPPSPASPPSTVAPPGKTPAKDAPAKATATTRADTGAALYKKNGCFECHVNDAQGGPQGPRLGPNPIPLPRFMAYVRGPSGDMPPFTKKVLSDDDLQSIYAFLQALPTPPPVSAIPLLAP
jgi:mono/diheme cytochrome c family protein